MPGFYHLHKFITLGNHIELKRIDYVGMGDD